MEWLTIYTSNRAILGIIIISKQVQIWTDATLDKNSELFLIWQSSTINQWRHYIVYFF